MNDGRSVSVARRRDRRVERLDVLGVLDALHVPAVRLHPRLVVLAVEGDRRGAVDRDVVVVVADDQPAQPEVAGERRRFLADALHHVAVRADRVDVVIDELPAGAVEAVRQEALGDRHADRVCESLPERAGRDLDARGVSALGVPGRARPPLAELLEVVEAEVVTAQVQQRVLQHARVAGAQHEAVAAGPGGVPRVDAQKPLEQGVGERRQRHRRARMPGVGLLDRVHRQASDRVDRQLAHAGLVEPGRVGLRVARCGGRRHRVDPTTSHADR